jgi:hypothetical protein
MRSLLAAALVLLLARPALANDPSCTASGGIVGFAKQGDETVIMSCPDSGVGSCTCHGHAGPDGKCRVYPCDAKGNPAGAGNFLKRLRGDSEPLNINDIDNVRAHARHGDVTAIYVLGMMCMMSHSVDQCTGEPGSDPVVEAFRLFGKGASQGDPQSADALGAFYEGGSEANRRNLPEAYFWYSLAVRLSEGKPPPPHGGVIELFTPYARMAQQAQEVERQLTPAQIDTVKRRVRKWDLGAAPPKPEHLTKQDLDKLAADRAAADKAAQDRQDAMNEANRRQMEEYARSHPEPAPTPVQAPPAADASRDTSCSATGGAVSVVRKGAVSVVLSCDGDACTCHEPTAEAGECRVYSCNAKGEEGAAPIPPPASGTPGVAVTIDHHGPQPPAPVPPDTSCSAGGDNVSVVKKGNVSVVMSCALNAPPDGYGCMCHEPTAEAGKCRVYPCNTKGDAAPAAYTPPPPALPPVTQWRY